MGLVRSEVESCLDVMTGVGSDLGAVAGRMDELALTIADRLDCHYAGSHMPDGEGWTVSFKDNIDTGGSVTTYGSKVYRSHVPSVDAFVVTELKRSNFVPVAKVNLSEFAMGPTTENPLHGTCRNPWSSQHIAGGSSGGSGVAVAIGLSRVSLGTDTGGSVRIPASVNGVVGLRPTLGRVSSRGVMPLSPSFDTVGIMGRTALDVGVVLDKLDSFDQEDPTSLRGERMPVWSGVYPDLSGVRIGVLSDIYFQVDPMIRRSVLDFASVLRGLGCSVRCVDVPGMEDARAAARTVVDVEAALVHSWDLERHFDELSEDVRERLLKGRAATGLEVVGALKWRREWQRNVESLFRDLDVMLIPTVPTDVPMFGARREIEKLSRFTYAWSMFEGPSISVPCGFHPDSGLPIGAHMTTLPWMDSLLIRVAHAYQCASVPHERSPSASRGGLTN